MTKNQVTIRRWRFRQALLNKEITGQEYQALLEALAQIEKEPR